MKVFFEKYISFSWNFVWIPLIFLIIAASGGIYYLSENFKLNGDFRALFAGENHTVKSLKMLENRVGSATTLSILVSSPNRDKNIAFMRKIAPSIKALEKVRFVEYERDIEYLEQHGLLYLSVEELKDIQKRVQTEIATQVAKTLSLDDESSEESVERGIESKLSAELDKLIAELDKEKNRHHIRRYFEAENGTLMVMKVRPAVRDTAVSATKKIVADLERVVTEYRPEEQGLVVEVGGFFRNKVREIDQINKDLYSTLLLCVFLLILVIVFYFRSIAALAVILLPLTFGVLSGVAITLHFLGEFNIVSASSFAILYGLGIDFGIHLFARYTENRALKQTPLHAMIETYSHTVPAIISGAITTALAFFSIVFIEFKGFSDFGFIAGVGVTTSLVAILFFFPILIFLFEKTVGVHAKALPISLLSRLFTAIKPDAGKVIFGAFLLTLLAVWGVMTIPFEYRLNKLSFPRIYQEESLTRRYSRAVKKEKTDVISTAIPTFILTDSSEETLEVTKALRGMMKPTDGSDIFVKDFINIHTFLPDRQNEKLHIIKRIKRLVDRKIALFDESVVKKYKNELEPYLAITTTIEKDKIPEWIRDKLKEKNGSIDTLTKIALSGNKNSIKTAVKIREQIPFIQGKKKRYPLLATYFLLADIKEVLHRDVPLAIFLSLSMVFLTLLFMFRSLKEASIVILPLIIGLVWMVAVANILGFAFNIFNMIVVPTVVGIGIDSAIHIYHRYREEGVDEMSLVLKTTGGAVLFSALTTFVGFISLAFAQHNGMKSIGEMASVGIVMVTFVNIILFPILIYYFSKKKKISRN